MANKNGTNYFVENGDTNVKTSLSDENGNAVLVMSPSANIPAAKAGYAVGCLLINTTSGSPYVNIGSTTSCSFLVVATS